MTVNVAGLDLSMTGTGWATSKFGLNHIRTGMVKTSGTKDDRLFVIRDKVRRELEEIFPVELVLMEDYASFSKTIAITAMVHGSVRSMLIEHQYRYAVINPQYLKAYATGSAGADKSLMRMNAYKRAGIEFATHDECDAFWLWVMANDLLDQPVFSLPAVQRDMLKHVVRKN